MSQVQIDTALDQAHTVESILRVIWMAIEAEKICATSFADNGGGSLIDMTIGMMGDLIEKIETIEASLKRVSIDS